MSRRQRELAQTDLVTILNAIAEGRFRPNAIKTVFRYIPDLHRVEEGLVTRYDGQEGGPLLITCTFNRYLKHLPGSLQELTPHIKGRLIVEIDYPVFE